MNPQQAIRRSLRDVQSQDLIPLPQDVVDEPRGYRCAVCNAGPQVVTFVNRLIASGIRYTKVHEALGAVNEGRVSAGRPEIGYQSVQRHGRDHLPAKSAAIREIVERRARAAQLDVEDGTTNIITTAAYAEVMMTRAMQEMADFVVTPAEGLQAAKFLHHLMQAERGNVGMEAAFAELGYLIEAVKEIVPQQYIAPLLARIDEKRGSKVIDAEVAEEFDPGEQPEDDFSPADDGDEDF